MLCPKCLSIFSIDAQGSFWSSSFSGPHHSDISSLQSAAQECRICKAIWFECVIGFGKEDWSNAEISTRYRIVHQYGSVANTLRLDRAMELRIEVERTMGNDEIQRDMTFDLLPYDPVKHHTPESTRSYDQEAQVMNDEAQRETVLDWLPDDLVKHESPENTNPVNPDTKLLEWYQDCLSNHKECRPIFDEPYTPSRLLEIGQAPSGLVKLIVSGDECFHASTPEYATLSHCWGTSQPLRLLTTNMQQLKEGIALEAIPRIFSEAIEVCWHLGIRYLWIDCLCIIQDSVEDWARESQLMGIIYSRAMINIGATASTNCNGSLFNTATKSPSVAVVAWTVAPQKKYIVVENNVEWGKSFMNQPLLRRAWVMQERFLATRMIHFTKSELVWECRTTAATESYPIRVPDALWSFHDRRNRFWRTDFTEDDGAWAVLVGEYSKCELTFGKDKLVALAGLVSALEAKGLSRGRYWAGMWEADLPYCLLWRRGAIDPSKWLRARPTIYRAPSWSWASLNYPIWTDWASGTSETSLVSHWEVKEDKGPSSAASLLLYYPLSIHLVGPITPTKVRIKKPWVEAIGRGIERVKGISYSISKIVEEEIIPVWDDAWNDVIFDDFDDSNLEKRIWCAPIYECEEWIEDADNDMRLLGLLLEEVDDGTFRRIGAFSIGHLPDRRALKQLRARTYTII